MNYPPYITSRYFNISLVCPILKECSPFHENQASFRFQLEVMKAVHGKKVQDMIKEVENVVFKNESEK